MKTPTSIVILFYLTGQQVKELNGNPIAVPGKVLDHKDTRKLLRDYQRLLTSLGEARTLEGIALSEAFFDVLGRFWENTPMTTCCGWAGRLRPWMRGSINAIHRVIQGAYSLEANQVIPDNYGSARDFDAAPFVKEAESFWGNVRALNLKPGMWVLDASMGGDDPVFIDEEGDAQNADGERVESSSPESWSLPSPEHLRSTVLAIDARLKRLQELRALAEEQANPKGWYDRLVVPEM